MTTFAISLLWHMVYLIFLPRKNAVVYSKFLVTHLKNEIMIIPLNLEVLDNFGSI